MLSDITVVVDDTPGQPAAVAEVVAGAGINLDGLSLSTSGG